MQLHIKKQFDSTVTLYDWANYPDDGSDQYQPIFNNKGTINVYIAVDPASGNMIMEVPELLDIVGRAVISDPKNREGKELGPANVAFGADYPVPLVNAYGQVFSYRYRLLQRGQVQ